MDAFAWFWLAVIICIITIGVMVHYVPIGDINIPLTRKMKLLRTNPGKGTLLPDFQKMNN